MTSVEGSRFQVSDLAPVNQPPVGPQPPDPTWGLDSKTAMVAAPTPALPALIKQPITATDLILPGAAGSTWLASMAFAVSQGVSLPLLAAVGAAGLASVAVMGRNIIRARVTTPVVDTIDSAMAATHLGYATNTALDDNLRIHHGYKYVRAVAQLPAADAVRLFASMPQGRDWGIGKKLFKTSVRFPAILKSIGLTSWAQNRWTPYDIEATIIGLSKLGPVTDDQRARIQRDAMSVVRSFSGRSDLKEQFQADLEAAVYELCRRAPAAESATVDAQPRR